MEGGGGGGSQRVNIMEMRETTTKARFISMGDIRLAATVSILGSGGPGLGAASAY